MTASASRSPEQSRNDILAVAWDLFRNSELMNYEN